jgi:HK97 family phage major capsid protein
MPSTTALALSLMTNGLGQPEFPGINMMGGTLSGIPVITSEYVPTVTAGALVILVNASDIYWADEGGFSVDMSQEASLQMNDTGASHNSVTPAAVALVSMFQTNSVAFRAERTVHWARRRPSAVAVLDDVLWG